MATALNRTTITVRLTSADDLVSFASSSTLAAGQIAYIDREAMALVMPQNTLIPTVWRVLRGQCGTAAASHAVNNQVYTGSPDAFFQSHPQGASSQDATTVLPYINIQTGDLYVLSGGGSWQKIGDMGVPLQPAWASGTVATYTTAGAITPQSGSISINSATARAMTLAAPTQAQDGMVMTIYGTGGGAHTVTVAAGFNGAGGAYDVATFAAIGGTLVIQVINGAWWVLSATGVTIA